MTAGVECKDIDYTCDEARLLTFAKSSAAGGTVLFIKRATTTELNLEQLLSGDCGDADDRKKFPSLCDAIRKASPGLVFDNGSLWEKALASILSDYLTPEVKSQLDATIDEVRTSLWKSMYGQLPLDNLENHGSPTNASK